MKIMKKSLLALVLVSTASNLLPHGGNGGAWVGGTAIGLGTGLLIGSSMNRSNENPETYNMRSLDKKIRQKEHELRKAEKSGNTQRINRLQSELDSLNRQRAQAYA